MIGWRLVAVLAMLAMPASAYAAHQGAIWSGTSGGYAVEWTPTDIVVHRGTRLAFSASDWAKAGLAHFLRSDGAAGDKRLPDCDYRHAIRIVALVGTMMSLEDKVETTCRREAHPGGMTRLMTIDLAATGPLAQAGRDAIGRIDTLHPGRAVLLTKLFPKAEVYAGLSNAAPLRDVLRSAGVSPTTLPALLKALIGASGEGDACFIVPDDLLGSFAFDHVDQDRIVVRIGLPGDGPCRMNLTTETMAFALPAALADVVRQAASGEAGFLADRGTSVADGRQTEILLHTGRGGGEP